jgi:hypothetical protein
MLNPVAVEESAVEKIELPHWVPLGVMHVIPSQWPMILRPEDKAHILKVARDLRMARLWKELGEGIKDNPPDLAKVSAKWASCHGLAMVLDPPVDATELVLGLFFYVAAVLSVPVNAYGRNVGHLIRTKAEDREYIEREKKRIAGLRENVKYCRFYDERSPAAVLGILGDFNPRRCAKEMSRFADWLEGQLARHQDSPRIPIVDRNRGDRRVRAYVHHLFTQAREIFGAGIDDVLLDVVTTTTNVGLDLKSTQKRSQEQVRALLRGFGFNIAKAGS